MSWSPATPIVKVAAAAAAASLMRGGTSPVRLSISIRDALYKQMKSPKSLSIMVGHGEHEGKIRLTPDGDFPVTQCARGGARIMVARPSYLPDAVRKAGACSHQLDGKDLILTLPAWAPVPAGALASNGQGVVDHAARSTTTAALMGDPPRGRSALDQRGKR